MITKQQALGHNIFHQEAGDGPCIVWRRIGETETWEGHPDAFSIPVVNDDGANGVITEVIGRLYHNEEECPKGYVSGAQQAWEAGAATARALFGEPVFTDGALTDIDPGAFSANDQRDYLHRVLRRQFDEKLSEIQEAFGFTDLQMLEIVIHWMKTRVREMRDAEVEQEQT